MSGYDSKRQMAADKLQDGKCKLCVEGCAACDARAQPAQDVDYWIREATAARQAEMALRRELEAQPAQKPVAFDEFLESQDFYELMQIYRHCLIDAFLPFEKVKNALRAAHIGEMK